MTDSAGSGRLGRENLVVLHVVQALLGLISKNMIAIAVHVSDERIVLRFWVHEIDQIVDEDVQETIFELESLFTSENPQIDSEIHLGPPQVDWPKWAGRMVYWAKGNGDSDRETRR